MAQEVAGAAGTVLVTGGAGFIGSHLVDALVAQGRRVRVLDNLLSGKRENLAASAAAIEFVEGDVRDAETVAHVMGGVEAVFHEAAIPSVVRSFEDPALVDAVNVGGTVTVLAAAQRQGVRRVVLASSCAVYGASTALPLTEESPLSPLSPYAVVKLACEEYARVLARGDAAAGSGAAAGGDAAADGGVAAPASFSTICLRYFNVYGPRQDPSSEYSGVIAQFMARVQQGLPLVVHGDGAQTRDFVFVGDVVQANLRALAAAPGASSVVNVGAGRETSVRQLAETVCAVAGVPMNVTYGAARQGDVARSLASLAWAREVLGYAPSVELGEGLRRMLTSQGRS
ncbi:MAG: NAD-dependent epimerase/dehydratase family protein [Thermoleophilia bacterium]